MSVLVTAERFLNSLHYKKSPVGNRHPGPECRALEERCGSSTNQVMRRRASAVTAQSAASACAPRRVHLSGLSVLDMSGSVGPCAPAVWRIVAFLAGRTACMRLAKEDMKMVSLSLLTTVLDGASSPCIAGVTFMDHVPGKIEGHIPGTK